jgi:hypothetical protein
VTEGVPRALFDGHQERFETGVYLTIQYANSKLQRYTGSQAFLMTVEQQTLYLEGLYSSFVPALQLQYSYIFIFIHVHSAAVRTYSAYAACYAYGSAQYEL